MLCLVVVICLIALFVVMYLMDRSAKRKGHQMRDPGAMGRLANDAHRDGEATAAAPMVGTADTSWTAYSRHNAGQGERSIRENDELDDTYLNRERPDAESEQP